MQSIDANRWGMAYQAAKQELWKQESDGKLIGLMQVSGELNLQKLVAEILRADEEYRGQLAREQ